jgi:hypothetical protein
MRYGHQNDQFAGSSTGTRLNVNCCRISAAISSAGQATPTASCAVVIPPGSYRGRSFGDHVVRSFGQEAPVRSTIAKTSVVQNTMLTPTVRVVLTAPPITLPIAGSSSSWMTTTTATTTGSTADSSVSVSRRHDGNSSGPIR